jgi:hypothetical protein
VNVPELVPDEMAGGANGRLGLLNGVPPAQLRDQILLALNGRVELDPGAPLITLLAALWRLTTHEFVQHHANSTPTGRRLTAAVAPG